MSFGRAPRQVGRSLPPPCLRSLPALEQTPGPSATIALPPFPNNHLRRQSPSALHIQAFTS